MNAILVPLDGSALAEQALPYVRTLARLEAAEIRLLRVLADSERDTDIQYVAPLAMAYGANEPLALELERERRMWERRRTYAETYLTGVADQLIADGFQVQTEVRVGPPADVIVEATSSGDIAMIVMVTHGYSGLKRWTLGSVTDKVAHSARCPVLSVRASRTPPAEDPVIRRILLPLDGSELSRRALPCARDLATAAGAELMLVRAIEPYPDSRPVPEFAEMLDTYRDVVIYELWQEVEHLQQAGVAASPSVAFGHAAEVIEQAAGELQVDLIVMATHGYSGLKRWALGSVADKVLHATSCPVLLVRV